MKHVTLSITSLFAVATLATGCAGTPGTPTAAFMPATPTAADCSQISAQIASTQAVKREALEKERDAWRYVVPFAVVARYSSSKSTARQADQQLAELDAAYKQQGCTGHGG
jgi:hypothetical protein